MNEILSAGKNQPAPPPFKLYFFFVSFLNAKIAKWVFAWKSLFFCFSDIQLQRIWKSLFIFTSNCIHQLHSHHNCAR